MAKLLKESGETERRFAGQRVPEVLSVKLVFHIVSTRDDFLLILMT